MSTPDGRELLRPFLPAKDFAQSRAFYTALGFPEVHDKDVALYDIGAGGFILQNYYHAGWAENCVVQLMVDDLDAWWAHIEALDLPTKFCVQSPKAPAMQSWGLRVAYLFDPSGVLWHVAERRTASPRDR